MDLEEVEYIAGQILRSFPTLSRRDTFRSEGETIFWSSFQRNHSVVNTGSQDMELSRMALAVIVPLKSGLQSFNEVSEILLCVGEELVLPDSQIFHDIRGRIVNMKQQLERSESIAAGELEHLDRKTELLTAEQGRLAREKRQKELELDHLQKQLASNRSTLENYEAALSTSRRNLKSAEKTLKSMKKRRDDAEVMRNVGIGVSFIPIVGLFAGPLLVLAGSIEMDQASKAVRTAKAEVNNCESDVSSYRNKKSKYKSKISEVKRKIGDADDKIHRVAADQRALSWRREAVADVQAKMRRAVHHLGELSGVGSVAELQTRRQVLLEPVMKVMEEMTRALGRITGDQLLSTRGIRSLMEGMRRNQLQLQQLAAARQTASVHHDYYYY